MCAYNVCVHTHVMCLRVFVCVGLEFSFSCTTFIFFLSIYLQSVNSKQHTVFDKAVCFPSSKIIISVLKTRFEIILFFIHQLSLVIFGIKFNVDFMDKGHQSSLYSESLKAATVYRPFFLSRKYRQISSKEKLR